MCFYGVKKEKKVTENLKLNPISVYNKTKMIAERVFLTSGIKLILYVYLCNSMWFFKKIKT